MASVPTPVRLRRAAVLALGAAAGAVLLLGDDPVLRFHWVPLVVGLSYLAAAVVGGKRGGLWATGLVLTGWGTGVVVAVEDVTALYDPALFLLGAGAGVLACAAAARAGVGVDLLGAGATLVLGAAAFALEREVAAFGQARTYVLLLAAVALVNLALALSGPGRSGRS